MFRYFGSESKPKCIPNWRRCGSGYFVNRFLFHSYRFRFHRFRFKQSLDSISSMNNHDYQNQQLTIYKSTLLVKVIA